MINRGSAIFLESWIQGASVSQGYYGGILHSFVLLPFNTKDLWKCLLQLLKIICCHFFFFQMTFEKQVIVEDSCKLLTFSSLIHIPLSNLKISHFSALSFLLLPPLPPQLGLLVFTVRGFIWLTCKIKQSQLIYLHWFRVFISIACFICP